MFRFRYVSLPVLSLLAVSSAAVLNLDSSNFDDIVLKSNKPTLIQLMSPRDHWSYYTYM
jgi:hypothetical protein